MKKSYFIPTAVIAGAFAAVVIVSAFSGSDNRRSLLIRTADNTVVENDEARALSGEVFSRNGAVYIPADDFLPGRFTTGWDAEKNALAVETDDMKAYIFVNDSSVEINSERTDCGYPTLIRRGVFYIPLTMYAQLCNDNIYIDGEIPKHEIGYRDLMDDTYITDEHRLGPGGADYNGIYIVNDSVGMERMSYTEENGEYYADIVNKVASYLPYVQVYDILIPTMSEFYGPTSVYTNQTEGIRSIYHKLSDKVIPINAVKTMWEHADEKLYFNTDHHWTQRGAYYAYRAFMENKDEYVPELSEFPLETCTYVGSLPAFAKGTGAEILRAHPDQLEKFYPVVDVDGAIFSDMNLDNKVADVELLNRYNNTYASFIYGDEPIERYVTSVKNGKKLMIVKESFGNAFATWAVNNYEEVFVVDPRYWNGFGGHNANFKLQDFYVNVCQFDDLVILSYPGSTTSSLRQAILNLVEDE